MDYEPIRFYGFEPCVACGQPFATYTGGSEICDKCLCIVRKEDYTEPVEKDD